MDTIEVRIEIKRIHNRLLYNDLHDIHIAERNIEVGLAETVHVVKASNNLPGYVHLLIGKYYLICIEPETGLKFIVRPTRSNIINVAPGNQKLFNSVCEVLRDSGEKFTTNS